LKPLTAMEETRRLHGLMFTAHKDKIRFVQETGKKGLSQKNHFPDNEEDWKKYFKFYDKRVRGGVKPICFFTLETNITYNSIHNSLWRTYIAPFNVYMFEHKLATHRITEIGILEGYNAKHACLEDAEEEIVQQLHKIHCEADGKDPATTPMKKENRVELGKRMIKQHYRDPDGNNFDSKSFMVVIRVDTENAQKVKNILAKEENPVPKRFGQFVGFNIGPPQFMIQLMQQHNDTTDDQKQVQVYNMSKELLEGEAIVEEEVMTVREALLAWELKGKKVLHGIEVTQYKDKGEVKFVYNPDNTELVSTMLAGLDNILKGICAEYSTLHKFDKPPYSNIESYSSTGDSQSRATPKHIRIGDKFKSMDATKLVTKRAGQRGISIGHIVETSKASTLRNVWDQDDRSQATKKTKNNKSNPTPGEAATDGNSRSSYGSSNNSSRNSRLSSLESKMTNFDNFVEQMKETNEKNEEQAQVMRELILQRDKDMQEERKLQNEATKKTNENFAEMMETNRVDRELLREQLQQAEKRHEEQRESERETREQNLEIHKQEREAASQRHAEDQKAWQDKFEQMLKLQTTSKRDYNDDVVDEAQRSKHARQTGTPDRVGALKEKQRLAGKLLAKTTAREVAEEAKEDTIMTDGNRTPGINQRKIQTRRSGAAKTGNRATPQADTQEEGSDPSASSAAT
jgi:hypothetical protein